MFVPLGRLTYVVYLIHFRYLTVYHSYLRKPYYYTPTTHAEHYFGVVLMVFFMAYAICLTVEVPLLNLERLLLRPNQIKSDTYLNLCMSYFLKYFFEQEKQLLYKRQYQTFTREAFDLDGFFCRKTLRLIEMRMLFRLLLMPSSLMQKVSIEKIQFFLFPTQVFVIRLSTDMSLRYRSFVIIFAVYLKFRYN